MKPIFSIHAGEYLVGSELEKRFKNCEVWLPSKDTGTDLLLTNKKDRQKNIGIQVKFSKDFLPEMSANFQNRLLACGWWALNYQKIVNSNADLWILAPYSFSTRNIQFIVISPQDLASKLESIHGSPKTINTYLWVTKDKRCIETRGLKKAGKEDLILKKYDMLDSKRDFSEFLNNWELLDAINR